MVCPFQPFVSVSLYNCIEVNFLTDSPCLGHDFLFHIAILSECIETKVSTDSVKLLKVNTSVSAFMALGEEVDS